MLGDVEKMLAEKFIRSLRSFHMVPLVAKTTHQRATSIAFIYNTFVGPVLLYNAGSWSLKGSETDKLDAFHQKHRDSLRIINVKLYARCRCRQISTYIQNIVKTNEMPHSNVGYDWAFKIKIDTEHCCVDQGNKCLLLSVRTAAQTHRVMYHRNIAHIFLCK